MEFNSGFKGLNYWQVHWTWLAKWIRIKRFIVAYVCTWNWTINHKKVGRDRICRI